MKKLIILAFAAAIFVSCSSRDDDPAGSGGQAYSGMLEKIRNCNKGT